MLFKLEIQQAMSSSLKHPLNGTVNMDEFFIGVSKEGKRGRSKGEKKLVVLTVEILEKGVSRAYAELICQAFALELGLFLRKHVSKESMIIANGWLGYLLLKKSL
jgi:hypothetical protein